MGLQLQIFMDFCWILGGFWGPQALKSTIFLEKITALGWPPYALPGAAALNKICKKHRKNCGFSHNPLLMKFKISSTFFALVALCCGTLRFFRDVVFGRLSASILGSFWRHLAGFGPPSWSRVGSSWLSIRPQLLIFGVFWSILAP